MVADGIIISSMKFSFIFLLGMTPLFWIFRKPIHLAVITIPYMSMFFLSLPAPTDTSYTLLTWRIYDNQLNSQTVSGSTTTYTYSWVNTSFSLQIPIDVAFITFIMLAFNMIMRWFTLLWDYFKRF